MDYWFKFIICVFMIIVELALLNIQNNFKELNNNLILINQSIQSQNNILNYNPEEVTK